MLRILNSRALFPMLYILGIVSAVLFLYGDCSEPKQGWAILTGSLILLFVVCSVICTGIMVSRRGKRKARSTS